MSSDQTGKVFGITTSQTVVPSGGWIGISGGPYVNSIMVNYMSGVTTAMVGSSGVSYTFGYILSANLPVVIGGPGPFWLTSSGSSSLVNVIKTLNSDGTT